MDNTELKKILHQCTDKVGFNYYKKNYYYRDEKMIVVINTQKSNYDNSFYINYGFWVRDIHDNLENPKINECDIVGRFVNNIDNMEKADFQLDTLEEDKLKECFEFNIENIIVPVINGGIREYFEIYPKAIMSAKRILKEYLENKK